MRGAVLSTFAPAKVNLNLHVLFRRPDGYHEIDSLVAFADIGDSLSLDTSRPLGLVMEGGVSGEIEAGDDNLVLRAAYALAGLKPSIRSGHFNLIKRLPVAAGLGGGSADAAAALRLLAVANGIGLEDPVLFEAAKRIGADVPVCLTSQTRQMQGIGERLGEAVDLPPLPALLINPGCPVSTADVFQKLGAKQTGTDVILARLNVVPEFESLAAAMTWLADQKNDLQPPAETLQPKISKVLAALASEGNACAVRMSGSGATCFALYASQSNARLAHAQISALYPYWWIHTASLGSVPVPVDAV